ncbi:transcription factor bHLH95-like [Melia azedarach]|uniref:Transcription factor bHLH95-like n=1 Tax=Melia azedarach TaxID=155640 RepID=A0ACC1XYS3_MELAZ|nr:transcription factor bHLH95-like [Melia azedarach]
MSVEGEGAGGGENESFVQENQSWALSISDNSGRSEDGILLRKNPASQLPPSNSNGPKVLMDEGNINEAAAAARGAAPSKKRDRGNGGVGKDNGNFKGSGEVKETGESEQEIHIWTERERRKKMRNMFANLHALLPQLPPKADKSTIVDEAVSYIKTLQQTLQKLQKQKLERLQGVSSFGFEPSVITPQKLAAFNSSSRDAFLADKIQGSSANLVGAIDATNSSNFPSVSPNYPVIFQTWTSSNVVLNICGDEAHISICSFKKPGLFSTICYVLEKHNIEVISAQVSSDFTRRMYMIQAHVNGASDQFTEGVLPVEEIYKQAASELMFWISS